MSMMSIAILMICEADWYSFVGVAVTTAAILATRPTSAFFQRF